MKKWIPVAALAALAAAYGASVYAQQLPSPPQVVSVGTRDLFQDVVNGTEVTGHQYATAQQINAVIGYLDQGVLATGQTVAFTNSSQLVLARSSATIAALTLTASPNPGDGMKNCYFNTQATTAITWNANTNQTITGAPTAGVANTTYCMIYETALGGWVRGGAN